VRTAAEKPIRMKETTMQRSLAVVDLVQVELRERGMPRPSLPAVRANQDQDQDQDQDVVEFEALDLNRDGVLDSFEIDRLHQGTDIFNL